MLQYVECKRNNITLRGMAHIPDEACAQTKVPAVLIFHGFSADRNEMLFSHKILADKLCAQGVASFRFDFMGSGESDGDFKDASVLTEMADAETILDYVRTLKNIDAEKIAIHGMSQGGLVACLLAGKRAEDVCCVNLWSPALCIKDFCQKGYIQEVDIRKIEEEGFVDFRGTKIGKIYYTDIIKTDYEKDMIHYKKPVQIIHGDADTCVPFCYSEKLKELLGSACTLIAVHGADHDYNTLEYNRKRIDEAIHFFKKQLF